MKKILDFFKSLDKLSLFVALLMAGSTYDSYVKGQWVWVAILGTISLLNLRIAVPAEKRWPKRLF